MLYEHPSHRCRFKGSPEVLSIVNVTLSKLAGRRWEKGCTGLHQFVVLPYCCQFHGVNSPWTETSYY